MDWFSVLKEEPIPQWGENDLSRYDLANRVDWEPTVDLRTGTSTDVGVDEDDCCDKIIRHLVRELRLDHEQDWIADQIEPYIGNCDGFMEDWAEHFGIHDHWEMWARDAGCTPFSEDTGFTTGEPMDIAYQLLKDEKPDLFGSAATEKPNLFGNEEEDDGTGHHLTVLGGDVKFEDKDTFNRKMQEWVDEHGMPSQMSSPIAGGIPLLAELWAMKNNIPHTPTNKKSFHTSTHFMMMPDVEGIDGHMERAMQSGKPVHFNYAEDAGQGKPFTVFNAAKQQIATSSISKPEESQEEMDTSLVQRIVNQELGARPATGLPTNAPANRKRIEGEQAAWDARYQELLDALGIKIPEPEPELPKRQKPRARRGEQKRKSISPFELAWAVLKWEDEGNVDTQWEDAIIDLYYEARTGSDAKVAQVEATLDQWREEGIDVDGIIERYLESARIESEENKQIFNPPKPLLFPSSEKGGQTMTTERGIETEAYKGTGGMWYSYPSGRIIGPDLPEGITEVPPPN